MRGIADRADIGPERPLPAWVPLREWSVLVFPVLFVDFFGGSMKIKRTVFAVVLGIALGTAGVAGAATYRPLARNLHQILVR